MAKIPPKVHPIIRKWAVPNIFGTGDIANAVRTKSKIAQKMVKVPLPCLNPQIASMCRFKYEKPPECFFERTLVNCGDGGLVGMDKAMAKNVPATINDKPIILIFPGLAELTHRTNIKTLCVAYLQAGYEDVFVCNHRGRCNTPFKTPQISSPYGRFNDVHNCVDHIIQNHGGRKILLVGHCFGGQCIVDYFTAGQKIHQVSDQILGGVINSVMWNTRKSYEVAYVEPMYSVYTKKLGKISKNFLMKDIFSERLGSVRCKLISELSMETPHDMLMLQDILWEVFFDGAFSDLYDHADKTSPSNKIGDTARPLVVINAADDPISLVSSEDIALIEKDANLCFWLFASGGHGAYVSQLFPNTLNFIDEAMVECSDIISLNCK